MRHLKAGKTLGRTSSHRKALFNNLVTSLVQHEKIVTTLGKAKELRRKADRMITLAKKNSLHSRRIAFKSIKNKDALAKLFDSLGPRFVDRPGGYTRLYHLGSRNGDAAKMAILEWVDRETEEKKPKKDSKKAKDKKPKKEAKEKSTKPKPKQTEKSRTKEKTKAKPIEKSKMTKSTMPKKST